MCVWSVLNDCFSSVCYATTYGPHTSRGDYKSIGSSKAIVELMGWVICTKTTAGATIAMVPVM